MMNPFNGFLERWSLSKVFQIKLFFTRSNTTLERFPIDSTPFTPGTWIVFLWQQEKKRLLITKRFNNRSGQNGTR